jgi:DNA-binding protein HU-beta
LEVTKQEANRFLDAFIQTVFANIDQGIRISGFGSFGTVERKARVGRNPATGKPVHIPAKKAPVFKAGANLKSAVKS